MPEVLFASESDASRSLPLTAQRLVNWFTEKERPGAKSQTPLFPTPGLSAFCNTSTIIGGLAKLGTITGGSGYGSNTFQNVPLSGGNGTGAVANITISGGVITVVTLVQGGSGYQPNDVLTAANTYFGGTGSGFTITVSSVAGQGVASFSLTNAGGYIGTGLFNNVTMSGGSGSGCVVNIGINQVGITREVTAFSIAKPGASYRVGDVLTPPSPPLPLYNVQATFQVTALVGSAITGLTGLTGGSGYNSAGIGQFNAVPLTGGSGTGAVANITVTSGAVSAVFITSPGINYVVGDVLSASNSHLGGSGSGFSVPVTSVDIPGSVRGSWVKQDIPYVVAGNSLFQIAQADNGTYSSVPLTGGFGTGAIANLTVANGAITAVALLSAGLNYQIGDVLSAPLGGGTGFQVLVATLASSGIMLLGAITGGSGYTEGTYLNVPLTGGSGTGAVATINVDGGNITGVTITSSGKNYAVNDNLSASNFYLGGAGSGFSVPVVALGPNGIATLGAVTGGSGYEVGVPTLVGSGIGGTDLVGMSDNGFQLCIVSGQAQAGWIYDTNPQSATYGFQQITNANFFPAQTVSFFDGYFVFDRMGTNEIFVSALYDGTTYNALAFASASSQPDFVTGTIQNLQLLFIICQQHIEVWYDAGATPFPFARYTGSGLSTYGCVSPRTIIKQEGAVFFLGIDKVFYRLQSTIAIRISTHAMEHIIAEDGDITQAYCLTMTLEGHKFIVLTLPVSGRTLIYDTTTQRWHERESWDQNNVSLGQWRATTAFRAFNQTYIGDAYNGNVNLFDWTTYTELGNTMRGLAYSIPYHQDRKRLFISRFELDIQAGVGLPSGAGSDPQIMLTWSVDGANTFQPLQMWRSMGKLGQFLQRLRWLRMGVGWQFVFSISCTDPVPRTIISAHVDSNVGM